MAELSARYASALFDLAMEDGNLDEFTAQSIFLRDSLQDDECRRFFENPVIATSDKHLFIKNTFAGHIHDNLLGFLYLAVAKSRENAIVPALTRFIAMIDRYNRKVTAEIVTAHALNESQLVTIRALLSKKLDKQVEMDVRIDPAIIGGLYIRADGYLFDFTLKQQLYDLSNAVKNGFEAEEKKIPSDTL